MASSDDINSTLQNIARQISQQNNILNEGSSLVFNVKDYQAAGDGTANDSGAVARTLAAAPDYSIIFFPHTSSFYNIGTDGILVDSRAGLIFTGPGRIKFTGAPSHAFSTFGNWQWLITNCTKCFVEGLNLDGGDQGGILAFLNNTRCGARWCDVSNAGGVALAQVGSAGNTGNKFIGNVIHDSGGGTTVGMFVGGVNLPEMETGATVIGNELFNQTATNLALCGTDIVCTSNTCHDTPGSGIIINTNNDAQIRHVTVSNNVCYNNVFHGIQADVFNDIIPFGMSIAGNICHNNNGSGIFLNYCDGWAVSANTCYDNSIGISCRARGRRYSITGNTCFNSGVDFQQIGISIRSELGDDLCDQVIISSNIIGDNRDIGIEVAANNNIKNMVVSNNTVRGNRNFGIKITGTIEGLIVTGNSCKDNPNVDIRVDPFDAFIEQNTYYEGTDINVEYATFPDGATAPFVGARSRWRANNSAPTTLTNFGGVANGYIFHIYDNAGNLTINNNANIFLNGGVSAVFPVAGGGIMSLWKVDGVCVELSRSF